MSSKDPMRDALQMMVYMIESNAPQLCGPVFENAKKLLAQPAGRTSDSVECARCVELEALCDATHVAQGADAYNHACSEMERRQARRKQTGKDVGTEGSLCDGIAWLFERIKQLESLTEAKGAAEPDQSQQCIEVHRRKELNTFDIMQPRADGRSPVKMAFDLGMRGSPATEAQRLLFESWMKGHCWMVCGEWDGSSYRHPNENAEHIDPGAMHTRQLWATWRDCSALCEQLQGQPQSIINQLELTTRELADLVRFDECASDNEGYDVPKERMKALARIGVVNHVTAGIYCLTKAGQLVLDELENQSKQKATV